MIGLIDSWDVEYNGTENVALFKLVCDSAAELSSLTHYDNIKIQIGSECTDIATGDKYLKSSTAWVLQPQTMFPNLYTKSEIDTIVNRIDDDISDLHTAVAKIIDTGAKNMMQTASSSGTRFVNVPIVLEPGVYHVYFGGISSNDTDAQTCQFAAFASDNSDASNYLQLQRVNGVNGILTVSKTTSYVRLYASNSYANSAGDTITFSEGMICNENDWSISQKYVPYCPTLADLYAMVRGYHP